MNKQPRPGEWWKTREGKRVYIAAVMPDWFTGPYPLRVFSGTAETDSEKYTRDGGYHFDGLQSGRDLVEHLPECTGWDWQPVRYPRYFETHDREYFAYLRQDSATELVLVQHNGEDYESAEGVTMAYRVEITEAEAMSRIVPAVPEWPKYVTNPTGWSCDTAYLRRDSETGCVRVTTSGMEHPNWWDEQRDEFVHRGTWKYITEAESKAIIEVVCRKDLPPTPTPATRTITVCEYIVWDDPGCERLVWVLESDDMLYRHRYPTGQTRTVEVPE
jgi:hypothetical protein